MRTWKFKLGIVVVFLLGVVLGAAGMGAYIRFHPPELHFSRPEEAVHHILDRLEHELALTVDQRKELEPIVLESFTRMRALRSRLTPEVEALMSETTKRIKEHLNPDQQRRLDEHNAEVLKRWRMWSIPGLPPGPPPAK